MTVIIITASYRDKEFVRVGYYVNTYYEEEEYKENPPAMVEWDKLYRNVLIEKPKVTRSVSSAGFRVRSAGHGATETDTARFQNPWDSGSASAADPAAGANGYAGQQQQQQGGNDMLFNAPLPPPVTKSAPPPPGQSGGMEIDVA